VPEPTIAFGTDGWRGIIAEDFTFENVRRVAQATADYFRTVTDGERAILVGHDVRFLSDRFARTAAEVFRGNGFRVMLLDRPCPTPYVSFEVKRLGLVGGVVVTASHNPSSFNGFKIKAHYGGSATEGITGDIERALDRSRVRTSETGIETVSPSAAYGDHLRALVDWERIAGSRLEVTVDSMHGCGGRQLEDLLGGTTCRVRTLRADPDPLFGGVSPEPMLPQLEPLAAAVLKSGSAAGLATDGDGDRIGVVSEEGKFLNTLQILPLLVLHTCRRRGWEGGVAYTFSQSQLMARIAKSLGREVFETPIGFKNIAALMLERGVLIGGEESGGIGVSRHLPERDGLFVQLLLLDMLAATGKSLTQLIRELWDEFGEFHFQRRDVGIPLEASRRLIEALGDSPPADFGGVAVEEVRTLDGIKLVLANDGWILFRRSGTEPILRIYCEAPTEDASLDLMSSGVKLMEQFRADGVT
jgi:phosphomannomutase